MTDSKRDEDRDDKKRDEVLRRLLNTPPKPHRPPKRNPKGEKPAK